MEMFSKSSVSLMRDLHLTAVDPTHYEIRNLQSNIGSMNFALPRRADSLRHPWTGRFYANQPHHSAILMFEKMTMVHKRTDGVGVAKIHS